MLVLNDYLIAAFYFDLVDTYRKYNLSALPADEAYQILLKLLENSLHREKLHLVTTSAFYPSRPPQGSNMVPEESGGIFDAFSFKQELSFEEIEEGAFNLKITGDKVDVYYFSENKSADDGLSDDDLSDEDDKVPQDLPPISFNTSVLRGKLPKEASISLKDPQIQHHVFKELYNRRLIKTYSPLSLLDSSQDERLKEILKLFFMTTPSYQRLPVEEKVGFFEFFQEKAELPESGNEFDSLTYSCPFLDLSKTKRYSNDLTFWGSLSPWLLLIFIGESIDFFIGLTHFSYLYLATSLMNDLERAIMGEKTEFIEIPYTLIASGLFFLFNASTWLIALAASLVYSSFTPYSREEDPSFTNKRVIDPSDPQRYTLSIKEREELKLKGFDLLKVTLAMAALRREIGADNDQTLPTRLVFSLFGRKSQEHLSQLRAIKRGELEEIKIGEFIFDLRSEEKSLSFDEQEKLFYPSLGGFARID